MAGHPDPDLAAAGAVVVLGLPEGCAVGLDLLRYAAGPRFRGFAQVPAGVHLLHAGLGDLRTVSGPLIPVSVRLKHRSLIQ